MSQLLVYDSIFTNADHVDENFLLLCQNSRGGGLAKFPDEYPGQSCTSSITLMVYHLI
jgi:prenyltransferase beta subunit